MIHIVTHENRTYYHHALTQMHRQRHELFVENMGWPLASVAGLEIDAFDSHEAIYLIELDAHGLVLQSARLIPSDRPHLLGAVFAELCSEGPPQSPTIWEASRFCPAPATPKGEARRAALRRMIAAILETGLLFGFEAVTFVASAALAPLARRAGWDVAPLGANGARRPDRLSAHIAEISSAGLARVRLAAGLDAPVTRFAAPRPMAA